MGKGNSGLLSKFQTKAGYTRTGIIGPDNGHEVFKEVVLRVRSNNVGNSHTISVSGRMSVDNQWEIIDIVKGNSSKLFHISSWDYIKFECTTFQAKGTVDLLSSAYFNDGTFIFDAINKMNMDINRSILKLTSEVCDIEKQINIVKKQLEFITNNESCEVE